MPVIQWTKSPQGDPALGLQQPTLRGRRPPLYPWGGGRGGVLHSLAAEEMGAARLGQGWEWTLPPPTGIGAGVEAGGGPTRWAWDGRGRMGRGPGGLWGPMRARGGRPSATAVGLEVYPSESLGRPGRRTAGRSNSRSRSSSICSSPPSRPRGASQAWHIFPSRRIGRTAGGQPAESASLKVRPSTRCRLETGQRLGGM